MNWNDINFYKKFCQILKKFNVGIKTYRDFSMLGNIEKQLIKCLYDILTEAFKKSIPYLQARSQTIEKFILSTNTDQDSIDIEYLYNKLEYSKLSIHEKLVNKLEKSIYHYYSFYDLLQGWSDVVLTNEQLNSYECHFKQWEVHFNVSKTKIHVIKFLSQ